MNLPVDIRDELLTGYLDDRLSHDEQQRVERLLATDPETREVYERLRANREILQQLGSQSPRLDGAFAARVWSATAAAAVEDTSLGDSHPVRLAQRRKAERRDERGLQHRWKVAGGVMAALAASLLVVLTVVQPGAPDHQADIVQTGPPQDEPALVENGEANGLTPEGRSDPAAIDTPAPEALVENGDQPQPLESDPAESAAPDVEPEDSMLAEADRSEEATDPRGEAQQSAETYGALAELLPGANGSSREGAGQRAPAGAAPQFVLMYEVVLTERGVANGILDRALSEAGIELGQQAVLDADAAESLASVQLATPDDRAAASEAGVQLWFIEAPIQRIDYLFLTLAAATNDVERVGQKLVANPPVVSEARQMAEVDPKAIRQPGGANLAIRLAIESAGVPADEFVAAGDLGTTAMRPRTLQTKEEFEAALRDAKTVISPVLLLVRTPE